MNYPDIAKQRIVNQYISTQKFRKPADIVAYMGAIQAQDYAGAKWAIGLRLQKSNDAAIDKAMAKGDIIRTHVLRPTWHFISPADARWMIDLTAPRINALSTPQARKLQLDGEFFKRSNDALAKALESGKQLNRAEITEMLHRAGIATDDLRLTLLLMRAELDKIICSGARQGKQFTYALFDDRVPSSSIISKEEALTKLALKYFTSRGPATLHDFTWWSGLSVTDAKKGLDSIKPELNSVIVENREYWMAKDQPAPVARAPVAHLLPAYDEFAVAYKDRTSTVHPKFLTQARYVIFDPSIIVNNQVVGTWERTMGKSGAEIHLNLFGKLNKLQAKAVAAAAERYRRFVR